MEPLFLIACLSVAAVDLPAALPCASPCTDGQCELSVVVTADVRHAAHAPARAAARRSVGVVRGAARVAAKPVRLIAKAKPLRRSARVAVMPLKAVRGVRLICPRPRR